MLNFLAQLGIATVLFFAIDMVWLVLVANKFYDKQLGTLKAKQVNWVAALVFYVLYMIGLTYFVINPAILVGGIGAASVSGALFGLVCYATYDLTNLATLKNWPKVMTLVDLVWGTAVSAAVSVLTVLVWMIF